MEGEKGRRWLVCGGRQLKGYSSSSSNHRRRLGRSVFADSHLDRAETILFSFYHSATLFVNAVKMNTVCFVRGMKPTLSSFSRELTNLTRFISGYRVLHQVILILCVFVSILAGVQHTHRMPFSTYLCYHDGSYVQVLVFALDSIKCLV